ncbi:MAG: cation:proton antiporter [Bacteroidota bacterium]
MLFAAGAAPPFFAEVAVLIVAGAVIGYVCYRFGLVPIIGFLVAGVVIGPNGLGLVSDRELVDAAAEVGVILLLFTIGIEFSLERLARIKTLIFGAGGLQVGLSTGLTMGILMLIGVSWQAALFTGFLVALSSTAIVLKLLGDKGETNTEPGQVALGLLIFQDLAIIVMVMLVPMLSGTGGSGLDIALALGKAGALIVAVLVVARRLMPLLLERVARTCSQELFLLALVAICFGMAYLTSLADVSLSLGAFLAGLMVSESRFSEHAFGEVLPLQIIFSATFFVSVGMLLDLGFLVTNLPLILGVIVVVLLIKLLTTAISVRALGYGLPTVAASSLILAQVGEFSFVLERAGRELGLTPAGMGETGAQTFIAATVILMTLTPFMATLGTRVGAWLEGRREPAPMDPDEPPTVSDEHFAHLEHHVLIAGYGKAARHLVRVLSGSGIPHLIVTLSPTRAQEAEAEGIPVLRGDIARQRTLEMAGATRAKVLVIPDDDPQTAHRIATVVRTVNPALRIVACTLRFADAEDLEHAGIDRVIVEEMESIVQLFAVIMHDYQVPAEEVEQHVATMRAHGYVALRDEASEVAPPVVCDLDYAALSTRSLRVEAGAPVVGHPLRVLDLDRRHGLRVDAVHRGTTVFTAPDEALELEADDEVFLQGPADAVTSIAPLFHRAPPDPAYRPPSGLSGDGAPRVEVYGADWCVLTGGFRAYLRRKEVPHVYFNIEDDPAAEERVRRWNDGELKFPMVVVGDHVMKNPKIDVLDEALAALHPAPVAE